MAPRQPNPKLILSLVSLPIFIGALDLTIISAVLPAVIADLKVPIETGLDTAKWVVSGYLLAYAISMTFMGRVSDLWGRRFIYLISLVIFFVGSWLVAISGGIPAQVFYRLLRFFQGGRPDQSLMGLYALIFGRVVQAFGAGAMVPVSMALVADLWPPERRALPLGVVGAVDTSGWVLGHLYGGIMVRFMHWTWLFWINLPVTAIMFVLTWRALREVKHERPQGGVDWIGATLIGLALLGLNVGLGYNEPTPGAPANAPDKSVFTIASFVAGFIFLVAFLLAERRLRDPLLNLKIFGDRNLSAASGINFFVGFCIMVGLVSVPLFINAAGAENSEEGALVSGYLLSALTVPMALASIPGGFLADRVGYRWSVLAGLGTALLGFLLMSRWEVGMAKLACQFIVGLTPSAPWPPGEAVSSTTRMILGLLVAGVGIGLTIAPIGTAVINSVGPFERGMASALVIILRLIGMSISVSLLTTYGLHRTTTLSRAMITQEMASDFSNTGKVAVEAITQITREMSLIAAGVCVAAILPSFFLRHFDKNA